MCGSFRLDEIQHLFGFIFLLLFCFRGFDLLPKFAEWAGEVFVCFYVCRSVCSCHCGCIVDVIFNSILPIHSKHSYALVLKRCLKMDTTPLALSFIRLSHDVGPSRWVNFLPPFFVSLRHSSTIEYGLSLQTCPHYLGLIIRIER